MFDFVSNSILKPSDNPLEVEEVISFLRNRWGVTYELRILLKGKRIYLQMMWGFLEQQSFPLNESEFREKLSEVIDILNRLGQASYVRYWLFSLNDRPRIGRALSLPLMGDERLEEFVL